MRSFNFVAVLIGLSAAGLACAVAQPPAPAAVPAQPAAPSGWQGGAMTSGIVISPLSARTEDTGSTWRGPLETPATQVTDPSRDLLIGVTRAGNRLVAVGGHGLIAYSDDNGQTWRQALVPTSESITCVAFADAKTGWAAGGQGVVLHTNDAGATWQLQLTGDQVIPLMQTVVDQLTATKPTDDVTIRAQRRLGHFINDGNDKPFLSILPLSPQSAIIFGSYRMTVMTTDGGKSWADWSMHIGDQYSHNMYDVAQSGNAFYLSGELGDILRSDDGGLNYAMVSPPDPSTFLGIMGTPKNAVLTYGVASEVFRSTDQGKTWVQSSISSSDDLLDGIVLNSGTIVLISENGGVFESKDDGVTFQSVSVNLGMAPFALIQAANGDVVFVGSGGVRVEPESLFN